MDKIITYSLSEDFILRLADFVEENFLKEGKDISRLSIVFGGKRPSLFLKKELSARVKKGYLAPRFFSIDEFIEYTLAKKGPFRRASDLDSCFSIYKLAQKIAPDILKGKEGFSKFLPWAREVIAFIEQLDLEDIEAASLKDIQEKAGIGYDVPENINALLESIIALRQAYQQELAAKNTYSRGLAYLAASRYIQDIDFREFDQVLFCGFFYLHRTEAAIIKNLFAAGKARLFFQGDEKDWTVLAGVAREFNSPTHPRQEERPKTKLHIQAGFDLHSEACLVREALGQLKNLNRTVIVLPAPDNLIPLLTEVSASVDEFNVSTGYPLKRSSLYWLFTSLFKAQETKKGSHYYAKDYLRVIAHPLIKNLKFLPEPALTRVLVHKIEEVLTGREKTSLGGSLFVRLEDIQNSRQLYDLALETAKTMDITASWDELKTLVGQLHKLLFTSWEGINNFQEFSLSLETLLEAITEKGFLSSYPLNLKMAERIFAIKEELKHSSFRGEPFPKEDIFKIFENKINNEMVSFAGSPLKGLQILGLFETRSLSFENVIVMDVNEAVLPSLKVYEPLIPREVMINLGLNRLEKEEEIQRYQFKRLISGARNTYLIYQARPDKERSRFIEELIWEKEKSTGSLDVFSIPTAAFKARVLPKRLKILKKPDVLSFLREREYSASSINTYLDCPLRFYYQYVLGLAEKEDLLDEPEGADIGTFIHELLRDTFTRFIGRSPRLDAKFEKEFSGALDTKFSAEFERKMKSDSFLVKEVLSFRMARFLEKEKQRDVKEILALEKTFRQRIQLGKDSFRFKAVIDRIDRLSDGSILILDYKTGSSDIMPETDAGRIESAGLNRCALKRTIKSFQLPLYLYLVDNNKDYRDRKTNACLYFIKDIDKDSALDMLFKGDEQFLLKDKTMRVYLEALDAVIKDILDPDIPFEADDEDPRKCATCPFFYLCR